MTSPSPLTLLFFVAATHLVVDLVAGSLNPLWPRFNEHYDLNPWQATAVFFLWQMTTSVTQFFFGLYGDRFNCRWLLWAGPIAATICLGSIGLFHSPLVLAILLAVSGLGIAAYHPEAASLAGSCAPSHRSRAMSVFTMGGFIGQAVGPSYSGSVVQHLGLSGLAWGILGGLAAFALLLPLGRAALQQPMSRPPAPPVDLTALFRGRTMPLLLVLIVGSLRIVAAAGVPVLIGFLLDARQATPSETGGVQSAFMFGIGLGGLLCATLLRPEHERPILWLCPLLVTPVLVATPLVGGWTLGACVALSGLLLGVSLPVLISYGQQLMPDSQRIASSITMGVSWGLGGGVVSLILAACNASGRYEPAFYAFAAATVVSSVLCIWLPRLPALTPPGDKLGTVEVA
jgi:FSR family fosmidomycin resistance protein-like MFS transporter